jgi:hypothetical protein
MRETNPHARDQPSCARSTLMREINARTDIGGVHWTTVGLRDLLTVT